MSDELEVTARFYDTAAARYDAEVDGLRDNVRLRDAFRRRVSSLAGQGGTILDFGCGTGTDAAWYAGQGHRVLAYDISAGMVAALRARCDAEIARGAITALSGNLASLVAELESVAKVSAIAANFAVMNHVRDLRPLLATLSRHVAEEGSIAASLLNPFYRRDMVQGWWLRAVPASVSNGAIRAAGDVTTYRHFKRTVSRMAAPHFELTEWRGASSVAEGRTAAIESMRAMLADNFVFAILRKRG